MAALAGRATAWRRQLRPGCSDSLAVSSRAGVALRHAGARPARLGARSNCRTRRVAAGSGTKEAASTSHPPRKALINSPETCVVDAIEGLVLTNANLARLPGSPKIKVVVNRNHDRSKVALISGGGSGHEPAHAGYVGDGMLAAAVCGDVFASPSTEAVLAAIRAVTGAAGCLLIVKNYTGDRLNFGLAAEQALIEGYQVEVVVVGEDVAIDQPSQLTGRRGLAGTVLVHKAAGAAAAAGRPLAEVAGVAAGVAARMGTLGVGLTVCTLPGKAPSDRLGPAEVEVGLGIHGEPGRATAPLTPAADLVGRQLLGRILKSPHFKLRDPAGSGAAGRRAVLLVNSLGATPPLEVSVAAREALAAARAPPHALTVDRVLVGPFMTSLDMAGVSLTLLSYDVDPAAAEGSGFESGAAAVPTWEGLLALLDAPTEAPGWPYRGAAVPGAYDAATLTDLPYTPPPPPPGVASGGAGGGGGAAAGGTGAGTSSPEAAAALGRALRAAAAALVAAGPELDAIDAKVGDGDCGATLAAAATAVAAALDAGTVPLADAGAAVQQVGRCVRTAVGGSSGALYDILLTAAARSLQAAPPHPGGPSPADWAAALAAGLAAVQKYGRAGPGCRTMLDALLPAAAAAAVAAAEGQSGSDAAAAAAAAAEAGAEGTKGMAASAGRASYVPREVLAAVPDPGAVAAAVWLRAVAGAVRG